jgi:hypothetical protein
MYVIKTTKTWLNMNIFIYIDIIIPESDKQQHIHIVFTYVSVRFESKKEEMLWIN